MKTYKKIVSFGDSFLAGTELKREAHSWASIAAEKLNVEYETFAQAGCGNESITKQILTYFSVPRENTLAIINWTWGLRYDFYLHGKEVWLPLCPSNHEVILKQFLKSDEASKISDFYLNYAGKSILWDRWRSLQTIYTSQQFLNNKNIPSIQTYMDYNLWDNEWHCPDYIENLQDLTNEDLQLFEGRNFLDWSYHNGFSVTEPGRHPLEDAHEAASELWLNTYQGVLNND